MGSTRYIVKQTVGMVEKLPMSGIGGIIFFVFKNKILLEKVGSFNHQPIKTGFQKLMGNIYHKSCGWLWEDCMSIDQTNSKNVPSNENVESSSFV